jgi:Flp pilus assembly protein TadD
MSIASLQSEGLAALDRGQWQQAHRIGTRMLALGPGEPAGHFIAGVAALRLGDVEQATTHLHVATQAAPGKPEYLAELARAHVTAGRVPEAVAAADAAMALEPRNALVLDMLGVIYGRTNFHEKARLAFQRAVERMPDNAASRFNLASAFAFAGDIDRAEREFEDCLRVDPAQWRAYLFLSQLRRQTPERNHLARLHDTLGRARGQVAELYLHMALAKEYEDLDDMPAAFAHLTAGKAAGGRGRGYSIERDVALFDAIRRCFPGPVPSNDAVGFPTDEPIFIIGMPRSGTTLVERILSSHPQVHSAGELRNFLVALHRHVGSPQFLMDPDLPRRMETLDWTALGAEYLDSTRPGTGHTLHFVDKLPHNFLYAGFIARALPKARIVCLRRDPVDTCLSNFRQVFALESPHYDYSFDLLDTGRYYVLFDRLIAHWKHVLPGRIHELSYEALVEHQEDKTRELLAFCGLSWDEACLQFERNTAPVATASAVQVRSAMYRSAMKRWKRYEPQLAPLLQLLADAGITSD